MGEMGMMRACLLCVLAIGACASTVALAMVPAEQRAAAAELIASIAVAVAGVVGSHMHEDFPRAMGVTLFVMGMVTAMDAMAAVGYPYGMTFGPSAIFMTAFAGANFGMAGGMWETCGNENTIQP